MVAVALAALAVAPATAEARGKSKVLRGNFTLVGADGDYTTGKFGKAQLVDTKRRDKLSVHIRRVSGRSTWTFKLQTGSCGGTEVRGWKYRKLRTSRRGVGNSWARSRTFRIARGAKYFVAVYDANGRLALCARLSAKGKAKPHKKHGRHDHGKRGHDHRGHGRHDHGKPKHDHGKPKHGHGKPGHDHGKPKHEHGKPGHDHRGHGKPDHAPGKRGKSDDAPRGRGRG